MVLLLAKFAGTNVCIQEHVQLCMQCIHVFVLLCACLHPKHISIRAQSFMNERVFKKSLTNVRVKCQ